jgi:hypothetical protein
MRKQCEILRPTSRVVIFNLFRRPGGGADERDEPGVAGLAGHVSRPQHRARSEHKYNDVAYARKLS